MNTFEYVTELACPPDRVYQFLIRPANAIRVTPPHLKPRLLEGPEVLQVGSRLKFQIRRYGIPQTIESEVVELLPDRRMRDDQVRGPFRLWQHTHELEPTPTGTRMTDRIVFEPPGGCLRLIVSAGMIRRELLATFRHREAAFRSCLESSDR
jgi:ligand-binding SRPBCC domain-containing protein